MVYLCLSVKNDILNEERNMADQLCRMRKTYQAAHLVSIVVYNGEDILIFGRGLEQHNIIASSNQVSRVSDLF